jgi:hypothetical protein
MAVPASASGRITSQGSWIPVKGARKLYSHGHEGLGERSLHRQVDHLASELGVPDGKRLPASATISTARIEVFRTQAQNDASSPLAGREAPRGPRRGHARSTALMVAFAKHLPGRPEVSASRSASPRRSPTFDDSVRNSGRSGSTARHKARNGGMPSANDLAANIREILDIGAGIGRIGAKETPAACSQPRVRHQIGLQDEGRGIKRSQKSLREPV